MFVNQRWLPGEMLRAPSRRHVLGLGAAALSTMMVPRSGHATTLPGSFIKTAGRANDISESFSGVRVVVGAGTELAGGWPVYRVVSGGTFTSVGGQGVRIAADRAGNVWLVTLSGQIFFGTFNGTSYGYQAIPAPAGDTGARDVGVGWDGMTGSVWIVGAVSNGSGNGHVYQFNNNLLAPGWTQITGSANRITADLVGNPWVTTFNSEIWNYDVASATWTQVAGSGTDIGVGLTSSISQFVVWVVGGTVSPGPVYQNTNGSATSPIWESAGGSTVNIAGTRGSGALVTNTANQIFRWVPAA